MNFCPNCGGKLEKKWVVCPICGVELKPDDIPVSSEQNQKTKYINSTSYIESPRKSSYALNPPPYKPRVHDPIKSRKFGLIGILFGLFGLIPFYTSFFFGIVVLLFALYGRENDDDPSAAVGAFLIAILCFPIGALYVLSRGVIFGF